MSEYQYVEFRALDRPLTDGELAFAEKQSTRAEISRWSFVNEYHYGDFRGDVNGLLRHGYDIYFHYANFGVRTVAFRLPAGLLFLKPVWSQYLRIGSLAWKKDRRGDSGILTLCPDSDAEEIEEIWNPGEYADSVVEVRNRMVAGDLRALYVLWLCAATNDQSASPDVIEPVVPGGLAESVETYAPFLEFFGIDPLILLAASEGSPPAPKKQTQSQQVQHWVEQLNERDSKRLLHKFMTEDTAVIKAQTIAAIRHESGSSAWPTVSLGRSLQMLLGRAEQLRADDNEKARKKRKAAEKRKAAKRERERQDRMKEMKKEPKNWLREAERLADARGIQNYQDAADILADLREAVGGVQGETLTRKHAAHLVKKHPTLNRLKSSLRKRDLLG